MEHKTVSLADQVFEKIENDILSGELKRGEIITETFLSSRLGVSRTPIREALRRLEQEHLIEDSLKGSVVIGVTESDLDDIYLIRNQIESLACKMAAQVRTENDLAKLKEILELQEFYVEKEQPDKIRMMDNEFHEALYKMCGRNTFYEILTVLHRKIQKYRKASVTNKSYAKQSVSEHREIFEAIEKQDGELAFNVAKNHIENAYNRIVRK